MATIRQELETEIGFREEARFAARDDKSIQLAMKRSLDIVGGVCLLVALIIPWIIVAIIIRIDSKGPIFLRQSRVGRYGQVFGMYKFRTMCDRADEMLAELKAHNEKNNDPLFKMRSDPRMTRVGRWLRKTSIDEMPQLLNTIRGEMSLVGPRPPLPREVQVYTDRQLRRLDAKPGMTGLWQVSGRSLLSFDEMVDLDLKYIEEWSFARDIVILAKTVPSVVSAKGAY